MRVRWRGAANLAPTSVDIGDAHVGLLVAAFAADGQPFAVLEVANQSPRPNDRASNPVFGSMAHSNNSR